MNINYGDVRKSATRHGDSSNSFMYGDGNGGAKGLYINSKPQGTYKGGNGCGYGTSVKRGTFIFATTFEGAIAMALVKL